MMEKKKIIFPKALLAMAVFAMTFFMMSVTSMASSSVNSKSISKGYVFHDGDTILLDDVGILTVHYYDYYGEKMGAIMATEPVTINQTLQGTVEGSKDFTSLNGDWVVNSVSDSTVMSFKTRVIRIQASGIDLSTVKAGNVLKTGTVVYNGYLMLHKTHQLAYISSGKPVATEQPIDTKNGYKLVKGYYKWDDVPGNLNITQWTVDKVYTDEDGVVTVNVYPSGPNTVDTFKLINHPEELEAGDLIPVDVVLENWKHLKFYSSERAYYNEMQGLTDLAGKIQNFYNGFKIILHDNFGYDLVTDSGYWKVFKAEKDCIHFIPYVVKNVSDYEVNDELYVGSYLSSEAQVHFAYSYSQSLMKETDDHYPRQDVGWLSSTKANGSPEEVRVNDSSYDGARWIVYAIDKVDDIPTIHVSPQKMIEASTLQENDVIPTFSRVRGGTLCFCDSYENAKAGYVITEEDASSDYVVINTNVTGSNGVTISTQTGDWAVGQIDSTTGRVYVYPYTWRRVNNVKDGDIIEESTLLYGDGYVYFCKADVKPGKDTSSSLTLLTDTGSGAGIVMKKELAGTMGKKEPVYSRYGSWKVTVENDSTIYLSPANAGKLSNLNLDDYILVGDTVNGNGFIYFCNDKADAEKHENQYAITLKQGTVIQQEYGTVRAESGKWLLGDMVRDGDKITAYIYPGGEGLTITTQPSNVKVEAGATATFQIEAKGEGLTYQWKKSTDGGKTWANLSASSAKSATLSLVTKISYNGMKMKCVVTDQNGKSVTSYVVTLTVTAASNTTLAITTQPSNTSVVAGATANFKVVATGEGLTYQWQKSTDGGKTWANSSSTSAKTATLSLTAKVSFNNYQFKCVVTDKNGKKAESNAAKLTVTAASSTTLAITKQPANASVAAGATANFKVVATGEGLTYQWQKSTDGGKTWANSSSTSAKTATLSLTAKVSFNNYQFKCVVTDKNGKKVESNAAKLTVTAASATTLAIISQPASVTAPTGSDAAFTVKASGEGLTYQWKLSKDGGATWANSGSTGAKTATLTMAARMAYSGYQVKCVVTDKNGKSVTSNAATLTVTSK